MVEIFTLDRTILIGRFARFKNAKASLEELRQSGYFEARRQAVFVRKYKNGRLENVYVAVYRDGWRTLGTTDKKLKKSPVTLLPTHYIDYSKLE